MAKNQFSKKLDHTRFSECFDKSIKTITEKPH